MSTKSERENAVNKIKKENLKECKQFLRKAKLCKEDYKRKEIEQKNILSKKESKIAGITLIALVITVIVILLLAGVSISMISGDNGILVKTRQIRIEGCHGVVKEDINLMYAQYIADIKTVGTETQTDENITRTTSYIDYLKLKGILDQEGKVNVTKLAGEKMLLGNGTSDTDIYVLRADDEENAYILEYYERDGSIRSLLSIAKDTTNGNIDYSKMEPGLYKTGTNQMLMSWEELVENDYVACDCLMIYGINKEIPSGDLVIGSLSPGLPVEVACPYTKLTKIIIPETDVDWTDKRIQFRGFSFNSYYADFSIEGYLFDQCTELREIHFLGEACINEGIQYGMIDSLKTCTNLQSINMSQECYDNYDWQGIVDQINEDKYMENFINNLPVDETERQNRLTEIFIKAMNYIDINDGIISLDVRYNDLQDVLGTDFNTLLEFYEETEVSSSYSSLEEYIGNIAVCAYALQILDDETYSETERWNKLTEMFIKGESEHLGVQCTTLQDVWNVIKEQYGEDYTQYNTLKDFYDNELSSSFNSIEEWLISVDDFDFEYIEKLAEQNFKNDNSSENLVKINIIY